MTQRPSSATSGLDPLRWQERLLALVAIVLGTAVLCSFALYNRFPFIISDTGTYVASGFELWVPADRPIFYGLLIRAFSFGRSFWPIIIGQCAAVAWLVHLTFRQVARARHAGIWTVVALTLLVCTTSVALTADTLCPDVTTPLLILSMALLQLDDLGRLEKTVVAALLVLSILCHTSNLPIATLLAGCAIAIAWRTRAGRGRPRAGLTAALVLSAWLTAPIVSAALGGGFHLTRASSAFLLARLAESGVLERTLDRSCSTHAFGLCGERARLTRNVNIFLWAPEGPVRRAGGFEPLVRANRGLLAASLVPSLWGAQFAAAVQGTVQCLLNLKIPWPSPWIGGPGTRAHMRRLLPASAPGLERSRQLRASFRHLPWLDAVQPWAVLLSLGALLGSLGLYLRVLAPDRFCFFLLVLFGVLANAAICGALSTPSDTRYMSRVAWLVVLLALVELARIAAARSRDERGAGPRGPAAPPVSPEVQGQALSRM